MKALRIFLYGIAGVVVLAVAALGIAAVVVDGKFVKARLERAMKEKHRSLTIEGEPKLKLFPVAGLALGRTTLSEPESDKPFVSFDAAEVALRVAPLLSGEIALETLRLSGLKASVIRGRDGRMNFADLAGAERAGGKEAGEAPRLRIAEIDIDGAQLGYRDEASGQVLTVSKLNLKTGRLDGDAPGPVSMSAHVAGQRPEVDLQAQIAGAMRFNLPRQEIGFDGFAASAKGHVDRDAVSAEFSAPKVEITPARASGAEVKGVVTVKGPAHAADVRFRVEGIQGSAAALSLATVALEFDAASAGNAVKGRISMPVTANLKARSWELPKIAADLTLSGPGLPQKTVHLPIQAAAKADLARQSAALELATKFDESSIKAKLAATKFQPLAATFDVDIDRLNLDRYIAAEGKAPAAKGAENVDLSALKGKTVGGRIAIGALTVKRVKLEQVKAEVKLANGRLEVAPYAASLYGGTLAGALSADASGNRIALKESAQNVAIGALLRDAAQKDVLEGKGNVQVDVQSAGATVSALKKALAGSARVEMKDGAIKGINLADTARNLKSALGGKQSKPDPTQKTDFSELSASFKIAGGVAHNDDLKAASPFLRLGGAGNLDIGNNSIDYLAKATLAATAKGQGGRDASEVAGITIPVKLSGPLDNPAWNVDYSALLGGAGSSVKEIGKKGLGGVKDAVRGLFGR
jgi:AsmA protein